MSTSIWYLLLCIVLNIWALYVEMANERSGLSKVCTAVGFVSKGLFMQNAKDETESMK
jgi:hypothetical protein